MNFHITDVRSHGGDASFLVDDGKTSILYDTGFGFTGNAIAENVKAALGERSLDYIFLTHSHYDHALGSAYVLRHYPNAKVVAGKHAADVFRREGAKRLMKTLDANFAKECGVTDYEFLGDELRVDIAVEDGDTVRAGDKEFQVLYLPGHTRCCVGYYCAEEGLLLANETLGVFNGKDTIMPLYLVSYADSIASIERIEKLPISSIVAPHCGLLDEAQTKYYLANMKSAATQTAAWIRDSLKKGISEEEIMAAYKQKYWTGYIRNIYPEDAINLNTSLIVRLIKNELA